MDPREFQRVAAELALGKGPGHWRSATSRAYYAVFNVAAELLRPIVPIGAGSKAHGNVFKALSGCSDNVVQQVGSDLGDLHSRRIDADYRLNDKDAERQRSVRDAIAEAQQMINALDHAFGSSASSDVQRSIQQYWTQVLKEPLGGCHPI